MASTKKLKILLVGPVEGKVDLLKAKLESLQTSKAGPFDVCFCVGNFGTLKTEMPLPTYVQDYTGDFPDNSNADAAGEAAEEPDDSTPQNNSNITKLATNLYFLGGSSRQADVHSIHVGSNHSLVVASCPSARVRIDSEETKPLEEKLKHVSYVGCDLLLTSEWPQGVTKVLPNIEDSSSMATSFDVAELALRARPRYHVASSGKFCQSLPFSHLQSSTSTVPIHHFGRFLALAPVVSPQDLKQKGPKVGKFVHALGLQPLHESSVTELTQQQQNLEPCPYTDASYEKDKNGDGATTRTDTNVGFSEAHARRIMAQESSTDNHRWASKRKRPHDEEEQDNSTNSTLFLHGLHKDVSGKLQTGSVALLQAFSKYGIQQVRRPPASSSSFCFLEFQTHQEAQTCLEELGGEITVDGIHLTIKWATHHNKDNKRQRQHQAHYMTEAEAQDSSTLYFKMPPKVLTNELESATEHLRKYMELTLESALAQDDSDSQKVTAETEPALRVKARRPETSLERSSFGFLEFASHAAASMALATLTQSTDGGILNPAKEENANLVQLLEHDDSYSPLMGVVLHWAKDAVAPSKQHGLSFQRRHFPPDARTDCWFCLASPTCEKHLVVSVHDACYIAMPKGPAAEGHVLIVPVAHSSRGALVDSKISAEVELLQNKLQQHASLSNKDLFCFERAIQTKGGYHTHVQCIPVDKGMGPKLMATMVQMSKSIPGFDLKEINSDLALSAIMSNDDDSEEKGGYFYAEIQVSPSVRKRFLYKMDSTDQQKTVPLQFGREVIATVLNKPDLAHWKACVVDEEKETAMTLAFRKTFEEYAS